MVEAAGPNDSMSIIDFFNQIGADTGRTPAEMQSVISKFTDDFIDTIADLKRLGNIREVCT